MNSLAISLLEKLPVEVGCGDGVRETYVAELKAVDDGDALTAFVDRWKRIWLLPSVPPGVGDGENALIAGDFDASAVLECVRANRTEECCEHVQRGESCVSMDLVMPRVLAAAVLIANRFGVPFDVALIQMVRSALGSEEEKTS